ncbi:MAG: hypothetical protein EOP45_06945, partial [Sphingobacteriaceae bacterium]
MKEVFCPINGVDLVNGNVYTFEVKSSVNPNFDTDNTQSTGNYISIDYTDPAQPRTPGYTAGQMYVNGEPFQYPADDVDMRFKIY